MAEIPIDKKTRWECQRCGKCCQGIIMDKSKDLSVIKNGKRVCKHFDEETKLCKDYPNRPFICRLYPFVIDMDKIKGPDQVARPQRAFMLENLKIHSECPGYGRGKRIYGNRNLLKKLDQLALQFAQNYQKFIQGKIKGFEVI